MGDNRWIKWQLEKNQSARHRHLKMGDVVLLSGGTRNIEVCVPN